MSVQTRNYRCLQELNIFADQVIFLIGSLMLYWFSSEIPRQSHLQYSHGSPKFVSHTQIFEKCMAVLVKDVPRGKIQLLILLQSSVKAISDN